VRFGSKKIQKRILSEHAPPEQNYFINGVKVKIDKKHLNNEVRFQFRRSMANNLLNESLELPTFQTSFHLGKFFFIEISVN